jgi:hypothetical protein
MCKSSQECHSSATVIPPSGQIYSDCILTALVAFCSLCALGDKSDVSGDKWKVLDTSHTSRQADYIPAFVHAVSSELWRYRMSLTSIASVPSDLEPLLTAEDVARRLNVSADWVWDHSSRKAPYLPVIRMSDGVLRYRASGIEEFLKVREEAASLRRKRR